MIALIATVVAVSMTVIIAVLHWRHGRRGPALPELFSVHSLERSLLRARLIRVALAVALGTVVMLMALEAPQSQQAIIPGAGATMVVVDISGSIQGWDYTMIKRTLLALAAAPGKRVGLVVFSDNAAELLPPQMPATQLRKELPLFVPPQTEIVSARSIFPEYKQAVVTGSQWLTSFSDGTTISSGLILAEKALRDTGLLRNGEVILISDLGDNFYSDAKPLGGVIHSLEHAGTEIKIVPLRPAISDREHFQALLPASAFLSRPELAAGVAQSATGGHPINGSNTIFDLLIVVLALLLALNELCFRPLRWTVEL